MQKLDVHVYIDLEGGEPFDANHGCKKRYIGRRRVLFRFHSKIQREVVHMFVHSATKQDEKRFGLLLAVHAAMSGETENCL